MLENSLFDKKSLRTLTQEKPDWSSMAKDAVCFANAAGGKIIFGIEDKQDSPPPDQKVSAELPGKLVKSIHDHTVNVKVDAKIHTHDNGGEFIQLQIFRSENIASTTSGRYYIRVQDDCKPLLPDDLPRLMTDKNAFSWELMTNQRVPASSIDQSKLDHLMAHLHQAGKFSDFLKQQSTDELPDYYKLSNGEYLTNLGILWLGTSYHRALLQTGPRIQFIKYDAQEKKVNKIVWNDNTLSPLELVNAVWNGIPDFRESIEITDGLFRRTIPAYEEVVIRELLVNAIIHRPYTVMGDIFINLFPDHLEIHNPGSLPLGITPENILHKSVQRNPNFSKLATDLRMMEQEGSGYDMIFQILLSQGKQPPVTVEGHDRVRVTVRRTIINSEIIQFIEKAAAKYSLRQKELISLGLIAQSQALTVNEFCKSLGLPDQKSHALWIGRLIEKNLVRTSGKTRAKQYFIEPQVLKNLEFKGLTRLKTITPHRLDELIRQDLSIYGESGLTDIHQRTVPEWPKPSPVGLA